MGEAEMYADAFAILSALVHDKCNEYTNLACLYRALKNKQFHIEQNNVFDWKYPVNNMRYVNFCRKSAPKFDMRTVETAIISIGVQHSGALKICRDVAKKYEKRFDLNTFHSNLYEKEEGELEEEVVTALRNTESNAYLYPVASFVCVNFV